MNSLHQPGRTRRLSIITLTLIAGALALPAGAQVVPGFLEGPLSEVRGVNAGPVVGERTVRINGVLAVVPNGTPITSPTNGNLRFRDIRGEPLPGRNPRGFLGGTCLCETEVDLATGEVTMVQMDLEPAENVILGSITEAICVTDSCDPDDDPGNSLLINGTLLNPNTDPRITSDLPTNRGFELNIRASADAGLLVGSPAAGEGYFGNDGSLHYYFLEIDGGILARAGEPEVSAERFQGRQRDDECEYRGRGFTHDPAAGTVRALPAGGGPVIFTTQAVADVDDPSGTFGIWDDRNDVGGDCADEVLLQLIVGGVVEATAIVPVDVRID